MNCLLQKYPAFLCLYPLSLPLSWQAEGMSQSVVESGDCDLASEEGVLLIRSSHCLATGFCRGMSSMWKKNGFHLEKKKKSHAKQSNTSAGTWAKAGNKLLFYILTEMIGAL